MKKENPKRAILEALSASLAPKVKDGTFNNVNEALKWHYAQQGHTELNTLKRWNELGFSVVKGSEALLLWTKPLSNLKEEQERQVLAAAGEAPEQPQPYGHDDHGGAKFFLMCYVFSNQQVTPTTRTA